MISINLVCALSSPFFLSEIAPFPAWQSPVGLLHPLSAFESLLIALEFGKHTLVKREHVPSKGKGRGWSRLKLLQHAPNAHRLDLAVLLSVAMAAPAAPTLPTFNTGLDYTAEKGWSPILAFRCGRRLVGLAFTVPDEPTLAQLSALLACAPPTEPASILHSSFGARSLRARQLISLRRRSEALGLLPAVRGQTEGT